MKKFLSLIMVVVLMISLSACGSSNGNETSKSEDTAKDTAKEDMATKDEQVTIKYMTFSAAPDHIKDLEAMIKAFEVKYPNIKVEYETASYNDYFTKLQGQIAGGVAPDTFELNYETFVTYANKGVLYNMSELATNDTDFDSSIYNQKAYESFEHENTLYGLVESFSDVVLFYNKNLFDEAGLEYPNENWTWNDELEAAQKLTNEEKGVYGTYAPVQFWEFYKTVEQNNGHILSPDKSEVVINSPENVETLQWMIDKINKYHVTPSDDEMSGQSDGDMFKSGKIAMLRSGIWMFSSFADADFDWDIALEPGNTSKAHHFFANCVAISNKCKHPQEAWLWSKFMTSSKEATQIRLIANWELPAITDEDVLAQYLQTTPPENKKVVFDALDTLVVPPVIENWNELTDIVGKELDEAKLGSKTPQEALDAAKEKLDALIKN